MYGQTAPTWTPIGQIAVFAPLFQQAMPPPPPPPPAQPATAVADQIDFEMFGDEMQFVEIMLDPGEAAIAEAGAFFYMDPGIKMETIFGDGSQAGAAAGLHGQAARRRGKRVLTGESLFMTVFGNGAQQRQKVAFAAPYPGKIIPIDLRQHGGTLLCQKDAFLCAAKGISVGIAFTKKVGAGLFGGEGFILQKLEGDGLAFVHAGGTIVATRARARRDAARRHRLSRRVRAARRLRHPVGRRLQDARCSAARGCSSRRSPGRAACGCSRCRSRGSPGACSRPRSPPGSGAATRARRSAASAWARDRARASALDSRRWHTRPRRPQAARSPTSTADDEAKARGLFQLLREDGTPVDEAALATLDRGARAPAVRGHGADPRHRRPHDGAPAPGPDRVLRRGHGPGGGGRRLGGGEPSRRTGSCPRCARPASACSAA